MYVLNMTIKRYKTVQTAAYAIAKLTKVRATYLLKKESAETRSTAVRTTKVKIFLTSGVSISTIFADPR